MLLSDLIGVLPFIKNSKEFEQIEVTSIETDSRKVREGSLFVCIKGFTTDGHLYVKEAEENGACAVVIEDEADTELPKIRVLETTRALAMLAGRFYHYPSASLPLIGVTGTNGKTTVSYLLEHIFQIHGMKTGMVGTIETKIGSTSIKAENTTPDALVLQKSLKQMAAEGVEQVIMEVSSHALDLGRVYGCDFDTVVFTNLTQDHLDYHGDAANYLRVKSHLFAQLGNVYNENRKFAVINADDKHADVFRKATSQFILTYGIDKSADVYAEDIVLLPGGTSFRLKTPVGTVKITSRLIGKFNIYNMLAAASAALVNNISLGTIQQAFSQMPGVPGRMEMVDAGQDYTVIIDYAHTPDALRNVIAACREFSTGKLLVVAGCGGERDKEKRPLMAKEAVEGADYTIITTDNPRRENPQSIIHDMIAGLKYYHQYEVILDRQEAICHAIRHAKSGDLVIIAGKGHETYQEVNGVKHPFDDRTAAKKAILA